MSQCQFIPNYIFEELSEVGGSSKSMAREFLDTVDSVKAGLANLARKVVPTPSEISMVGLTKGAVKRSVHDAQNSQDYNKLPGKLVRGEGKPSNKDTATDEAYTYSGDTHAFFKDVFGLDSIDNKGMKLISTVHFGKNYPNAFFTGSQMAYGDGDGKIFNRFTIDLDVIAHEFSHGLTQATAGLEYAYEPGALNEHFSDVFGSMVKQYSLKQTSTEADWLIGASLFTKNMNARGLRDMKNPGTAYDSDKIGKDRQPGHMRDYLKGDEDHGHVHGNSGIPNRAFATACINLGGNSWETCGPVWFKALTTKFGKKTQFQEGANIITSVAGQMYGSGSLEQKAICDGFNTVGIKPVV